MNTHAAGWIKSPSLRVFRSLVGEEMWSVRLYIYCMYIEIIPLGKICRILFVSSAIFTLFLYKLEGFYATRGKTAGEQDLWNWERNMIHQITQKVWTWTHVSNIWGACWFERVVCKFVARICAYKHAYEGNNQFRLFLDHWNVYPQWNV